MPDRARRCPPAGRRLPFLVGYIVRSAATGAAVGVAIASLLIATDAAGLRSLIAGSSEPAVPALLLVAGFATLIGSLSAGSAIMMMPKDDEDAGGEETRRGRRQRIVEQARRAGEDDRSMRANAGAPPQPACFNLAGSAFGKKSC